MQDRIWINLANIKFKAIYTSKVSRRSYNVGNIYSFFLAVASASSVAAWAIWNKIPIAWAIIVAISQLLIIAKPYIPFVKNDRELADQSLLFDELYLSYEKLWFEYAKQNVNGDQFETELYRLREKEHEINVRFKHVVCPNFKGIIKLADEETNIFLQTHFKR
ncbi:hypothetical protein ER57_02005 [Smithella sp. SCADC]|jgi:hypothetical protein|nr:hypothetical protein ER57_02005 [Smithella sp. SCADC]